MAKEGNMIKLFEQDEKEFTTLGLGVLRDAVSCSVNEKLNDEFELDLEYPITGLHYNDIRIGRIIYTKPNPYDSEEPFRIYSIERPINGIVKISAYHVSYDMNGIPVKAIDAKSLGDAITQIQNGALVDNPFTIISHVASSRTFKTTKPYNMRALLMGDDKESLLGVYNSEIKFNKFRANIYEKRGKNRGAQVRYGYNMTDLKHESSNDILYNGVFPFYHTESTSNETETEDSFTQAYIVGSTPFKDGWLSFTENGEPYHPLDSNPVQIATEGEYFEKVYCYDLTYKKYVEKIYNQTVMLVEGVIEPTWISIDWSTFPVITCRANAKGYYKVSTDDNWGDEKGVGDIIFSGNVLTQGLESMTSNMLIYYSEVIPSASTSQNVEVTEVVDVQLDDSIIWIKTEDARNMKYNNILSLDLTSEFDEEPSKNQLRAKAEEFISKNLLGTIKHNTEVSFIDLHNTSETGKYKNFEHVELGDTVRVIYEGLGVDTELRVIETSYNALTDMYSSVILGIKNDTLTAASIQNGDNISSLSNDAGYADITTVNRLIAKVVTADYIAAANAKLSKAQIEQLSVEKIDCSGIVEASQFRLDELISQLMVAENAKIAHTLEAGSIKVNGKITVNQGSILITGDDGTVFRVDTNGNLTANSVNITGGTLVINDGVFEVTNDGALSANNAIIKGEIHADKGVIGGCVIDENGNLQVPVANITGKITANDIRVVDSNGNLVFKASTSDKAVTIAGFSVTKTSIQNGVTSLDDTTHEGVYVGVDGIRVGPKFKVDKEGNVSASSLRTIMRTTIEYATSESNTIPPLSGWSTNIPSVLPEGYFLWTRMTFEYTDGTKDAAYSVVKDGLQGVKGDTGPQGPQGPQGQKGDPGSDANVNWTNIRNALSRDIIGTAKGIYTRGDHTYVTADAIDATWVNAGLLEAKEGRIGGFTIGETSLYSGVTGQNGAFVLDARTFSARACTSTISAADRGGNMPYYSGIDKLTVTKAGNLDIYIRVNSLSSLPNNYIVATKVNITTMPTAYSDDTVQAHTKDTFSNENILENYTKVSYINLNVGDVIYIGFRRNDTTYVYTGLYLVPTEQHVTIEPVTDPTSIGLADKIVDGHKLFHGSSIAGTFTDNSSFSLYSAYLSLGNNFSVDSNGSLTAKSGTIGGLTIGPNYLSYQLASDTTRYFRIQPDNHWKPTEFTSDVMIRATDARYDTLLLTRKVAEQSEEQTYYCSWFDTDGFHTANMFDGGSTSDDYCYYYSYIPAKRLMGIPTVTNFDESLYVYSGKTAEHPQGQQPTDARSPQIYSYTLPLSTLTYLQWYTLTYGEHIMSASVELVGSSRADFDNTTTSNALTRLLNGKLLKVVEGNNLYLRYDGSSDVTQAMFTQYASKINISLTIFYY